MLKNVINYVLKYNDVCFHLSSCYTWTYVFITDVSAVHTAFISVNEWMLIIAMSVMRDWHRSDQHSLIDTDESCVNSWNVCYKNVSPVYDLNHNIMY